jgi:hypothetical protein
LEYNSYSRERYVIERIVCAACEIWD